MVAMFREQVKCGAWLFLVFGILKTVNSTNVRQHFKSSQEVEAVVENENAFRSTSLINCARRCIDHNMCVKFHYSRHRQHCFIGNIQSKSNIVRTAAIVFTVYINQRKVTPACSVDFQQYQHCAYSFANYRIRWDKARAVCRMCDAHLVKIEDRKEDMFLVSVLKKLPVSKSVIGYWTGGHLVNGNWLWSDGTPINYTRWGPFEPDHPWRQKSLAYMKWFSYQWASHRAFGSQVGLGFICEKSLL